MKKTILWLLIGAGAGIAVGFRLGRSQAAPIPGNGAEAQAMQAARAPVAGEKVVHTFADPAAIQAFAGLWQQRQQRLARMGTLEGYWNSEQATLAELNSQLTSQYQLDLSKGYVLNSEARTLNEQEAPVAGEGEAAAAPAAPAATESDTPKIAHTFPDQAAMEAFAQLWQRRQGLLLRMAMLKTYWDAEQQQVNQLNDALATTYQMDLNKEYTLDLPGLVLLERPASQPAAAIPDSAAGPTVVEPAAAPSPEMPPAPPAPAEATNTSN